mmetsp:Transcript_32641/g.37137  ORF Transcript_32641/g.37137 Transcript_32641/m.37137 type:complete len:651 (-) Transcript_32641:35-1987(-)
MRRSGGVSYPQQQRMMQMHMHQQQQVQVQKKKLPSACRSITMQHHHHSGVPPTTTNPPLTNPVVSTKTQYSSIGSANSISALPPFFPNDQMKQLLQKCNWMDRSIYISKLLLGGSSVNGFSRATANAQRIKKQRARQIKAAAAAAVPGGYNNTNGDDDLKQQAMNPRLAKKIRAELYNGLVFCSDLQSLIKSVLHELDPSIQIIPLMQPNAVACGLVPAMSSFLHNTKTKAVIPVTSASSSKLSNISLASCSISSSSSASSMLNKKSQLPLSTVTSSYLTPSSMDRHHNLSSALNPSKQPQTQQLPDRLKSSVSQQQAIITAKTSTSTRGVANKNTPTAASPGDPNGSTLRKNRKRKVYPPSPIIIEIPETDPATHKKYSKKDQAFRLLEVCRYRALSKGDYVAAKVSSRDLWILARVVHDYKGYSQSSATEFLQTPKRELQFRDTPVWIQDVEDKANEHTAVARNFVLPLPRTFSEAADWGSRYRKGFRVYAMYPLTTSLYSGTVIDNTTYCRDEDDIIVVEFDGDEANAITGKMAQYHIPARFVTLIPKEFPAAQNPNRKRKSNANISSSSSMAPLTNINPKPSKRANQRQQLTGTASSTKASNKQQQQTTHHQRSGSTDSALNNMLDEIAYGDLALDNFDLGFQGLS